MNGLSDIESLLARRRDSMIKVILDFKDRECDPYLPDQTSFALRKMVLDQVNEFHDLVRDLVRSNSGGGVPNQMWLDKIDEIHRAVIDSDARSDSR